MHDVEHRLRIDIPLHAAECTQARKPAGNICHIGRKASFPRDHGVRLFMFGFDGDDCSVFAETVRFNRESDYDACAYSVLTPYPGTLTWYEMKKANRIVSFDWNKYDQSQVVYRPAQMSGDELRLGQARAYETFYALSSIAGRFPIQGWRHRGQWLIYNMFMRKGSAADRVDTIPAPTQAPDTSPVPPIMPVKREWRAAVLEGVGLANEDRL